MRDTSKVGPYFEILATKESGFPPGGTLTEICPGCTWPKLHRATEQLCMTPEMWNGDNIFLFAQTYLIVITDIVKERLSLLCSTNVIFEEI